MQLALQAERIPWTSIVQVQGQDAAVDLSSVPESAFLPTNNISFPTSTEIKPLPAKVIGRF
jgi:hypothetical protein